MTFEKMMNIKTTAIVRIDDDIEKNIALYFILSNGVVDEINDSFDLVDFQSTNISLNRADKPPKIRIRSIFKKSVIFKF
jgi:hypothetical protein